MPSHTAPPGGPRPAAGAAARTWPDHRHRPGGPGPAGPPVSARRPHSRPVRPVAASSRSPDSPPLGGPVAGQADGPRACSIACWFRTGGIPRRSVPCLAVPGAGPCHAVPGTRSVPAPRRWSPGVLAPGGPRLPVARSGPTVRPHPAAGPAPATAGRRPVPRPVRRRRHRCRVGSRSAPPGALTPGAGPPGSTPETGRRSRPPGLRDPPGAPRPRAARRGCRSVVPARPHGPPGGRSRAAAAGAAPGRGQDTVRGSRARHRQPRAEPTRPL